MARTGDSHSRSNAAAACTAANDKQASKARVTAQATQKNKRPRSNIAEAENEEPMAAKKPRTTVAKSKRQREIDNPPLADIDQAVPAKKARKNPGTAATKPESPTRRSARSRTQTSKAPGPVQKRKRRTPEEIAADNAKQEEEKRRKEELTKEKHDRMRQLDLAEDRDRANAASRAIRTFADLELEGETEGEEFEGYNDVSGSSGEDDEDCSESKGDELVKLREANRLLQQQIAMLLGGGESGKKKSVGGKKSVTFASGLRQHSGPKKQTHIEISAGGLDDSDAEAVNPFPCSRSKTHTVTEEEVTKRSQKTGRDTSRKNDLVRIDEDADEIEYVPHPVTKKLATTSKDLRPIEVKIKKAHSIIKVKQEPGAAPQEMKGSSVRKSTATTTKSGKPRRLNGSTVRVANLPEFAVGKWKSSFLPTLFDKFFTSDQPFDGFCQGSDQFIALLQGIIEEVYPDVNYEVSTKDSIHFLAYNRINEKRSSLGSNAIKLVEQHIASLKDEKAANDWLRWARRSDGPVYFQVPVSLDWVLEHGRDPKASEPPLPSGRLLSPFIINLARPFLALRSGLASGNGYPKGLFALVMAALERAVRHLSKSSEKIKEFGKTAWGSRIADYHNSFNGDAQKNIPPIPDTRWDELIAACNADTEVTRETDKELEADLSLLDHGRALIFSFPSPVKPSQ